MRPIRLLAPSALFLLLVACTTVPEETDKARGVLSGVNLVLALSVLVVVVAVGLIVGAIAVDRMVRSRGRLAEGQPVIEEEEEPEDEVVAGIRVGRAPPPRWLYAAYTLIPIFAFAYIFSNVRPPAREAEAAATPEPACEECEIAAEGIQWTKDRLEVVAGADITVTFDNTDQAPHDFTVFAAAEPGGDQEATSGQVGPGGEGTVEFTAPAAGETWSYQCTIHPPMVGTIEPAEG